FSTVSCSLTAEAGRISRGASAPQRSPRQFFSVKFFRVAFSHRLYFRSGDFLSPIGDHRICLAEPAFLTRLPLRLRGTPMPDSPAHNDFLRKISLDPGTERLATKKELIALLEKGEPETAKTSPRISASAEKNEAAKSSAAANSTAEKASADVARKN